MDQLFNVFLKPRFPMLLETLGVAAQFFPRHSNKVNIHHRPDIDLLSVIIRGDCRHLIGHESFYERGPCLGITPRGGNHCIITDDEPVDVMNIYLNPDRLILPLMPAPFQETLAELFPPGPRFHHRLNRVLRVDLSPSPTAIPLVFGLERELTQQLPGFEVTALDYLKLFLVEICRCAAVGGIQPSAPEPSAALVRINRVRLWLDHHYREGVTLEDLATMGKCSRNYLCRAFRNYTGKTVFEYLLERRIQAAMMRLRGGNEKIIAVALDCGFNELSYFNRVFKRLVGMSPSAYRLLRRPTEAKNGREGSS